MIDRVGLITSSQLTGVTPGAKSPEPAGEASGPSFRETLLENLKKVNQLQTDATTAIEDLASGRRDDVESVLMATAKADTAFRMLLAVRNKVMDAYEEVRQIRV